MNNWLRKCIVCLNVLCLAGLLQGQIYKTVPMAEKLKEPGLNFIATFDRYDVNADLATGNGTALSTPDISLKLRGQFGFDGCQAYKPDQTEELTYDLRKNLSPDQGTLTFWIRMDDYEPTDPKVKNAGVYEICFRDGDKMLKNFAYIYSGKLYFCIRLFHKGHGQMGGGGHSTSLKPFKRGEWIMIGTAWEKGRVRFFVNGKRVGNPVASPVLEKAGPGSYFSFACRVWGENIRRFPMTLDDIKTYHTSFSDIQMAMRRNALLLNPEKVAAALQAEFSGVDRGPGKVPFFRTRIDARNLDILTGAVDWRMTGAIQGRGQVQLKDGHAELIREAPIAGGKVHFVCSIRGNKLEKEFNIPDFSFLKQSSADLEQPIKPWFRPVMEGKRTVRVWGRKYYFDDGPFPVKIQGERDRQLLEQPMKLALDGAAPVWKAGRTSGDVRGVNLTGSGKVGNFIVEYRTRVEFDGMIRNDFVLKGKGQVKSLDLTWTVTPLIRQHLMTPRLYNGGSRLSFGYPVDQTFREHFMVWQVCEDRAGFCWLPETDRNWVSNQSGHTIHVDREQGTCRVQLIARPVQLDGSYEYSMFCGATPTRPAEWQGNKRCFFYNVQEGLYGIKDHIALNPDDAMMERYMTKCQKHTVTPYSMGHGQQSLNPMAAYMRESWDVPGAFIYSMSIPAIDPKIGDYVYHRRTPSTNVCPQNSVYIEYIVNNIRQLLNHKYSDRLLMLYFDLGGTLQCKNRMHGCARQDKFGRWCGTLNVEGMREFYRRITALAHRHGMPVMSHGQDCFTPFVNGICDYWYPGEQFSAMITRNHQGYSRNISLELYRTECNRDVLGSNVIFLPNINHQKKKNGSLLSRRASEGMWSMMLVHDINCGRTGGPPFVTQQIFYILQHYDFLNPATKARKYCEAGGSGVTIGNPRLQSAVYHCPDNRKLLVLANRELTPETVEIDLSELGITSSMVRDEYWNEDIPVKSNKFKVTVRPCNLALLALNPIPWYPLTDHFDRPWLRMLNGKPRHGANLNKYDSEYDHGIFRSAPVSMAIPERPKYFVRYVDYLMPKSWRLSNARVFPGKGGRTYDASVWVSTKDMPAGGIFRFNMHAMDKDYKYLNKVSTVLKRHNAGWVQLKLSLKAAPEASFIMAEVEAPGAGKALVLVDDFLMTEK